MCTPLVMLATKRPSCLLALVHLSCLLSACQRASLFCAATQHHLGTQALTQSTTDARASLQSAWLATRQHAHHRVPYLGQLGQQVRILSHHVCGEVIEAVLGLAV